MLQRIHHLLVALVVEEAIPNPHHLTISMSERTQSWFEEVPV